MLEAESSCLEYEYLLLLLVVVVAVVAGVRGP